MSEQENDYSTATIDKLAEYSDESAIRLKKLKQLSLILSLCIILTFVVFGYSYYSVLSVRFSGQMFAKGMAEELDTYSQSLNKHQQYFVKAVLPTYQEELKKMVSRAKVKWERQVDDEGQKFVAYLNNNAPLAKLINNFVENVTDPDRKVMQTVFESFPHLKDPEKQKLAIERIKSELASLSVEVADRYSDEYDQLHGNMEKLSADLPDDHKELVKLMLRNLTELIIVELDRNVAMGGVQ